MRLSRLVALLVPISSVSADVYWGFFQQGGTSKLFGSSFGLLGKDATFDYVVSVSRLYSQICR